MALAEVREDQALVEESGREDALAPARKTLKERIDTVADVAEAHADAVDREARFPVEAIAALKAKGLLSVAVPSEFGGEAASPSEVADLCYRLGRACSASAMIFAMHQIKVACLVRHGRGPFHDSLMRRLCAEQLLFASSTTEGQGGGNVRSSAAAIAFEDGRISLVRDASVISYGAQADGIVTTARRQEEAASSDQVLVVFLKEDYTLDRVLEWDTLGMRGTCSAGFKLQAKGGENQILPVPYDRIHAQTMTPVAHLLWGGVWSGIAAGAVGRAQAFTRKAFRQSKGQLPPGAAHHVKAQANLRTLRGVVQAAARRYEQALDDERVLGSLDFQIAMTSLKVEVSELALVTVLGALRACGLSGYRNDGDASIGRFLRDVLSAPLMINNDRILASLATTSLMAGPPEGLIDCEPM